MLIYIAGPMTGIEDFNYPAFREAEQRLNDAGYLCLNPVNSEQHNTSGAPQTWDWYMRHAIRMVTQSDAICLLPGWQRSKGARLEERIGQALGLDVRAYHQWLAGSTA